MSSPKQLRLQIEDLLDRRQWADAHRRLGDLWHEDGKATTAAMMLSCYDRLRSHLALKPLRVSFLRSMTIEPVLPILKAAALVAGIDLTVQAAQFGTYAQDILDAGSSVYSFDPSVVFLTLQTRDLLPEIWEAYTDLSYADARAVVDKALQHFATWIHSFRHYSNASLVIHTLEKPAACAGILDSQNNDGQLAAIERFNSELRSICREYRGVYLLDYDGLVARHGRTRWHDEGKWLATRMPFASDSLVPMAQEWLKFIYPLEGVTCKALVVDLDNTIWGGVLGEVGAIGVVVGSEYPGAYYRSLQRAILDLQNRGVLLAICSKNDHDDAIAALQNHPGMLLRPEHFVAFRINWRDKAENLAEIASELNIAPDAIAFLDDNPVERERIRQSIPEVKVIPLPDNPQGFAAALRDCPYFERLSLSAEDSQHTRLYHERQQRTALARDVGSLEDFYRSLDQEIRIAQVTPQTIGRVAQLTQKTNQFNVTTHRLTEQEIQEIAARPDWNVYSVQVTDRFGDNGIVGVMITRAHGEIREIDTFLLSCRVIGRTIETAMMTFLAKNSRNEGALFLEGWFVPTPKNGPVRDLYSSHQFEPVATDGTATLWRLNLTRAEITQPDWIRMRVTVDGPRTERAHA